MAFQQRNNAVEIGGHLPLNLLGHRTRLGDFLRNLRHAVFNGGGLRQHQRQQIEAGEANNASKDNQILRSRAAIIRCGSQEFRRDPVDPERPNDQGSREETETHCGEYN